MKQTATKRRGITIIEVAAAIVILSIALPPLMQAFADASTQTIQPSLAAVGSFLAIDRMEEIVARRYRGTDGYAAIASANFPAETPVAGFGNFSRTVNISFVNNTLAPVGSDQGYKKVVVVVSWNGGTERIAIEHVFADF